MEICLKDLRSSYANELYKEGKINDPVKIIPASVDWHEIEEELKCFDTGYNKRDIEVLKKTVPCYIEGKKGELYKNEYGVGNVFFAHKYFIKE